MKEKRYEDTCGDKAFLEPCQSCGSARPFGIGQFAMGALGNALSLRFTTRNSFERKTMLWEQMA